jgi:hypothetical protein
MLTVEWVGPPWVCAGAFRHEGDVFSAAAMDVAEALADGMCAVVP